MPSNTFDHSTPAPKRSQVLVLDGYADDCSIEQQIIETAGYEMIIHGDKFTDSPPTELGDAAAVIFAYQIIGQQFWDWAPNCRVISRYGTGVDTVDLDVATANGRQVLGVAAYGTESVSDQVFAHLWYLARQVGDRLKCIQKGTATGRPDRFCFDIAGKTLGILGIGANGRTVAERLRSVGFNRVLAFDPYASKCSVARRYAKDAGVVLCENLESMLRGSDVVTLHCPLDEDTQGMLNGDRIRQIPRGSIIINCARGGIIDESALLDALETGHLYGAGLDAAQDEPIKPDSALATFQAENPHLLCLSDHIGSNSERLDGPFADASCSGLV